MGSVNDLYSKTYDYQYKETKYIYNYSKNAVTNLWTKGKEPMNPDQFNAILRTLDKGEHIRVTFEAYDYDSDYNRKSVDLAKLFLSIDSWEYSKWKFPFKYVGGNIYCSRINKEKMPLFSDGWAEIFNGVRPSPDVEAALELLMECYREDKNWRYTWKIDLIQFYEDGDLQAFQREVENEVERRLEEFHRDFIIL